MDVHHFREVPMNAALTAMCLLVPLLAAAQSLDVKLGAWEMTHKSTLLPRTMIENSPIAAA